MIEVLWARQNTISPGLGSRITASITQRSISLASFTRRPQPICTPKRGGQLAPFDGEYV